MLRIRSSMKNSSVGKELGMISKGLLLKAKAKVLQMIEPGLC
jgi:hypothetical protein